MGMSHKSYRSYSLMDSSRPRDGRYLLINRKGLIHSRDTILELRQLANQYTSGEYTLYDRLMGCMIPKDEVIQNLKI